MATQPKEERRDLWELSVDELSPLSYVGLIDLLLAELCLPRDWHRALNELPFQN